MDEKVFQTIKDLISTKTGIQVKDESENELAQKISVRMKYLKLSHPFEYQQILKANGVTSEIEWKELITFITIGESYFFRDKGQIDLLKTSILPEIIEKRKADRKLRIWSAGCSTGEEPYSLAILLNELLPKNENWNLYLLGTDINEEALMKARKGFFTSWSFRGVNPILKKRYFTPQKEGWVVNEQIKNTVDFRVLNLLADDFPSESSHAFDMDLILCRNVLIYIDKDSIFKIVKKFSKTLAEKKFLITGHGDTQGIRLESLQPVVFPDSVVFQKTGNHGEEKTQPSMLRRATTPGTPKVIKTGVIRKHPPFPKSSEPDSTPEPKEPDFLLSQASELFQNGRYPEAIKRAENYISFNDESFEAHYIVAHSHANMSQHEKSLHNCQKAVSLNPFSSKVYFLMAHIEMDRGNIQDTKKLLKKTIYLDSACTAAYLELSGVYEKEGDMTRATRMRQTGLQLLQELPDDAFVEHYDGTKVSELIEAIKSMASKKLLESSI